MKRSVSLALIFVLMFSLSANAYIFTQKEYIHVVIGDKSYNSPVPAELVSGKVYAPFTVFEALGAETSWNAKERTMRMNLNSHALYIDLYGFSYSTDTETKASFFYMSGDYIMLPAAELCEYFGYATDYVSGLPYFRIHLQGEYLSNFDACAHANGECADKKAVYDANKSDASIQKPVYLTFDDGPSEYTEGILDLLDKYNMKATFFMLKGGINKRPDTVRRMAREGFALGLHGTTHRKEYFYSSTYAPANEMDEDNEALFAVTGVRTSLARVPYGSRPLLTDAMHKALTDHGYFIWDWNIDSLDSTSNTITSERVRDHVIAEVGKFETPIVLFHDKKVTLGALDDILRYLWANGYNALPLSEDAVKWDWHLR